MRVNENTVICGERVILVPYKYVFINPYVIELNLDLNMYR